MGYLLICTGVVGRGLTMASLGPRIIVSGETEVSSASEAGFVAFSDLCVTPVAYYQIPYFTVKPRVSVCDTAAARSVCSGYPQTKNMQIFL